MISYQVSFLSSIKLAFSLLTRLDRYKIYYLIGIQILLSILDLVAVILIGVLGSIAVNGVASRPTGDRVGSLLSFLKLDSFSIQTQASLVAVIAATMMIVKTVASTYLARKSLYFIAKRSSKASKRLINRVMFQDFDKLRMKPLQNLLYSVTGGIDNLTIGVLGNVTLLITDLSLTIIMLVGLFWIDPIVSFATLLFFGCLTGVLHKLLAFRAQKISEIQTSFGIRNNQRILEVLSAYRELHVINRKQYYVDSIGEAREKLALISAEKAFIPSISKYTFELGTILAAFLLALFQFVVNDAFRAITVLTIFLAASARISPALLRIQQNLIAIRSNTASAGPTIDIIESLDQIPSLNYKNNMVSKEEMNPSIEISNVSYKYPNADKFTLEHINVDISPGEFVAIVGPSGAGKSTLVDLILGIIEPAEGEIFISGLQPKHCIQNFPGKLAYVPQDSFIFEGTFRENVTLGYPEGFFNDEQIWNVLGTASLDKLVASRKDKLDANVGEKGNKLSGGQRQRIGIARALINKPKLIVMDEATSSLDSQTESEINEAIINLKGQCTLIVIAHRLSTVKNADKLIYMSEGSIIGIGTFNQLRNKISDFDVQALKMGL